MIRTLAPWYPIHGVGRYARGQGGDTLRVEILGAAQVAKFLCFARSDRIGAETDQLRLGLLHLAAHADVIVESPEYLGNGEISERTGLSKSTTSRLTQTLIRSGMLVYEETEIADACESVRLRGYCAASWQAEVVAISTPLGIRNYQDHILNISVSTPKSIEAVIAQYAKPLMALADKIRASFFDSDGR